MCDLKRFFMSLIMASSMSFGFVDHVGSLFSSTMKVPASVKIPDVCPLTVFRSFFRFFPEGSTVCVNSLLVFVMLYCFSLVRFWRGAAISFLLLRVCHTVLLSLFLSSCCV